MKIFAFQALAQLPEPVSVTSRSAPGVSVALVKSKHMRHEGKIVADLVPWGDGVFFL